MQWKLNASVVKNILLTKIQVLEKLNKMQLMLVSNCAVRGKEKSTVTKTKKLHNFE